MEKYINSITFFLSTSLSVVIAYIIVEIINTGPIWFKFVDISLLKLTLFISISGIIIEAMNYLFRFLKT